MNIIFGKARKTLLVPIPGMPRGVPVLGPARATDCGYSGRDPRDQGPG